MQTKKCAGECGEDKSIQDDFYKTHTGIDNMCKKCRKKKNNNRNKELLKGRKEYAI